MLNIDEQKTPLLIITAPHDDHAAPVQWALKQCGQESILWDWSYFPSSEVGTVVIDGVNSEFDYTAVAGNIITSVDTVWYRRPAVVQPMAETDAADVQFVKNQAGMFVRAALTAMSVDRWVNRPAAASVSEQKLVQLKAARVAGFSIPPTIISNCSDQIDKFRQKFDCDLIIKPFNFFKWQSSTGREYFLETARISKGEKLDSASIRLSPNIIQKEIKKKYELRVNVFGGRAYGMRLESQSVVETIDWRLAQTFGHVPSVLVDIDDDIKHKCCKVLDLLNLEFGAFDLIIAEDGEVYFIEVNQAGQFLFFDDCPNDERKLKDSLSMLQSFCQFISPASLPASSYPTMKNYLESVEFSERSMKPRNLAHPMADKLCAKER